MSDTQETVVIGVHSGKGGIGKTTTAMAVAYLLGRDQGKTMLVDLNVEQPSASEAYAKLKEKAPYDLVTDDRPEQIQKVRRLGYRFVIFDLPPSAVQAKAGLDMCDLVIVPFGTDWMDMRGAIRTVNKLRKEERPFRVLLTKVFPHEQAAATAVRDLLSGSDVPLFSQNISHLKPHAKGKGEGVTVFSQDAARKIGRSAPRGAEEYIAVRDELISLPEVSR